MLLSNETILGLGIILAVISLFLGIVGHTANVTAKRYAPDGIEHKRHAALASVLLPIAVIILIPAVLCFWKCLGFPF